MRSPLSARANAPRATSASRCDKVIIRTMILSGAVCGHRRTAARRRHRPHYHHHHRRRARLYRRSWYRGSPSSTPSAMIFTSFLLVFLSQRRGRDLHSVRSESVLLRYSHRHHSLLHHRIVSSSSPIRSTSARAPERRTPAMFDIVSFIPPCHCAGHSSPLRQHRRNAHGKIRQPQSRHPRHHVRRRYLRRHRRISV